MQYETMMRKIMDCAFSKFSAGEKIQSLSSGVRTYDFINRPCGPAVTVTIFAHEGDYTFANVVAAGLVRLRSNHRVLCWRSRMLGDINKPDHDIFTTKFVEGDGRGGHRPVPPFTIGDLSETDQALRYLLSCWAVTGRRAEHSGAPARTMTDDHLLSLRQVPLPRVGSGEVADAWPTDESLVTALQLGPEFVSSLQVA